MVLQTERPAWDCQMPSQKPFGRRATAQVMTASQKPLAAAIAPRTEAVPVRQDRTDPGSNLLAAASAESSSDVDRELEEWKAARKLQRRSFREPWRTLAIASAVGFGLSSWLLPDSVASVTELVTGALGGASFFAGFRLRQPVPKSSSGLGD
jgi:hypothetical protein